MEISVKGYRINYKTVGEKGPVAVVLQGWGTQLSVYDSVAADICDKYRVILLDLPGFGRSDELGEPWSVDDFADFVCEFLKALSVKEALLIGHSYGGRIIIKLAARKKLPFKITRIILMDSAGIVPEKTLWQKFKIRKYKMIKKLADMKLLYTLFPELIDDWRSRQGSADYRNSTPVMRACLVKAVNEDLRHLLPEIRQDVLLIWGDQDTATPISDARLMDSLLKNSGLAVIEGAGHYPFLDRPDIFRSIIRTYLEA